MPENWRAQYAGARLMIHHLVRCNAYFVFDVAKLGALLEFSYGGNHLTCRKQEIIWKTDIITLSTKTFKFQSTSPESRFKPFEIATIIVEYYTDFV